MVPWETVTFVFRWILMFPETKSRDACTSRFKRKQNRLFSSGPVVKFIIYPTDYFHFIASIDCKQSLSSSKIRGKNSKQVSVRAFLWAWRASGDAASRQSYVTLTVTLARLLLHSSPRIFEKKIDCSEVRSVSPSLGDMLLSQSIASNLQLCIGINHLADAQSDQEYKLYS